MIKTTRYNNIPHYELESGDTIVCKGIKATIDRITYQDYYDESWSEHGFFCEFYDTNGNYRSWKQYIDGGYVVPKEV